MFCSAVGRTRDSREPLGSVLAGVLKTSWDEMGKPVHGHQLFTEGSLLKTNETNDRRPVEITAGRQARFTSTQPNGLSKL